LVPDFQFSCVRISLTCSGSLMLHILFSLQSFLTIASMVESVHPLFLSSKP
jgi:hypothetical protein